MKTDILLIITTIIAFQTNAMEHAMTTLNAQNYTLNDIKIPYLSPTPNNQSSKSYTRQLPIPDEIIDQIIAQIFPQDRAHLKETCKHLSFLVNVNRLDKFVMHNFNTGNWDDKSVLFKAIIATSNPALITIIMKHAHKETLSWWQEPDSVCIDLEPCQSVKKEYIQKYATRLMQEALRQDNKIMIKELEKENYDQVVIVSVKEGIEYKKQLKEDDICCKCATGAGVTIGIGLLCYTCWIISIAQNHITYSNLTTSPTTNFI